MVSFTEISCAQLFKQIGLQDTAQILDVRLDEDFETDAFLIPSSYRLPYTEVEKSLNHIQSSKVIVVCHEGLKLSHGVAAELRSNMIDACALSGGFVEWRKQDLPVISASHLPPKQYRNGLWVTRHRPKIDRIACPWLVRRFVDRRARFLYVPPAHVLDVAARFEAISFDIHGGEFFDQDPFSSFDMLLDKIGLKHPALTKMAGVIRATDSGRLQDAPEAAGLLAFLVGLSKLHRSDTAQMEAGLKLYDALYLWARDGLKETHGWPHE